MVKKLEINIDSNIRLCLNFKASHLWDSSRIWVNWVDERFSAVNICVLFTPLRAPLSDAVVSFASRENDAVKLANLTIVLN